MRIAGEITLVESTLTHQTPNNVHAYQAVLAEAALHTVERMDDNNITELELLARSKSFYERTELDFPMIASKILPVMMEPALRISLRELELATRVPDEARLGGVETVFSTRSQNTRMQTFTSLRTLVPRAETWMEPSSQEETMIVLANRAILAEGVLQAVQETDPVSFGRDNHDKIQSIVQTIGPTITKLLASVTQALMPVVKSLIKERSVVSGWICLSLFTPATT